MNIELNFRPNFEGLVLGSIDADFASEYSLELGYIGKLSPRSTQCTPLHRSSISKFQPKIVNIFSRLNDEFPPFFTFLKSFSSNFAFFCEFFMKFVRISRQIPEKSDVCSFFDQICETN